MFQSFIINSFHFLITFIFLWWTFHLAGRSQLVWRRSSCCTGQGFPAAFRFCSFWWRWAVTTSKGFAWGTCFATVSGMLEKWRLYLRASRGRLDLCPARTRSWCLQCFGGLGATPVQYCCQQQLRISDRRDTPSDAMYFAKIVFMEGGASSMYQVVSCK